MRNWEIKVRSRNCSVCGQPFETGQTLHTLLTLSGEECERRDYCARCWKEAGPEKDRGGAGAAYWQSSFKRLTPPPEEEAIKRDVIERLLKRYLDSEEEAHLNLCYILALLEERKKVFRLREKIRDEGGRTVMVYEHTATGETFLIRDPHLTLAQVEAVQGQVRELIEAEKGREQPGTDGQPPTGESMTATLLEKYGFNEAEFNSLQDSYRSGKLSLESNLITHGNSWEVRLPRPEDSIDYPPAAGPEAAAGREIIAAGQLGLIFMNGGAATRFQKPGENLPKGAFPIMELEGRERSFMELKIANARAAEKEFGGRIPVWILNSYFTEEKTRRILEDNTNYGKEELYTYCQGIMKRVLPSEADLRLHYGKAISKLEKKLSQLPAGPEREKARGEKEQLEAALAGWIGELAGKAGEELDEAAGQDRFNPPGHLDTTLWLFLDPSRPLRKMLDLGVEYLLISNIDNLGALVDPVLPGLLARRRGEGAGILCEVSTKPPGQKGGALARVYNPETGREWCQLIEEFAFPLDFDQDRIPEFNNAAYTVAVADLLRVFSISREELGGLGREELASRVKAVTDRLPVYVAIKELKRPGRPPLPVVQFERLQGDLTRLLKPLAVKTGDRFFPVKKREDIPVVVPRLKQVLAGRIVL